MMRNILLTRGIPCCSKLLHSTFQKNVSHTSNLQVRKFSNTFISSKLLPFSTQFIQSRNLFIRVEETPNPLTLKFLPGEKILENSSRTYEFSSASGAKQSPLAIQLFRVEGVKNVFFGEDFISITKQSEDEDWGVMKPNIFATIMDYIQSGKPVITDLETLESQPTDTTIMPEDDDVVAMIKELLESRIKPMVQEDGGDVIFKGYEDGVVKLKLQGACTGCPSSSITLKSGIKNMMQFYVPEIQDVVEIKDEADQLIEDELKKFETKLGKSAD
uniref:NFU1 iron-sulfur cluster scaffold homolog, mitochondrial n=1 Tax=Panagrolaimus superbus TaxID=310955 RepID=A0A914YT76_9BILA